MNGPRDNNNCPSNTATPHGEQGSTLDPDHIIILGCGTSSGVPSVEGGWGEANPKNPKNRRLRTSAFIHIKGFDLLVDTSPDLRAQALNYHLKHIDAILYTHEHSDHIMGADDIRSFNRLQQSSIPCYGNKSTIKRLMGAVPYAFKRKSAELIQRFGYYSPTLTPHIISSSESFTLQKNGQTILVETLEHNHGEKANPVVGYKIEGTVGYITDILDFYNKAESIEFYSGLELLIISACVKKPHRSHMSIDKVLALLINDLKPKQALLTHLSETIDYEEQEQHIRSLNITNIQLAYDGLKFQL